MSLQNQINQLKIQAMKNKDKETLTSLREVITGIQNKEKELRKDQLTDEETLAIVQREIKLSNQSLIEFEKAGRTEDVAILKNRIQLFQGFLPKQLTADEIRTLVSRLITENGFQGKKDMGNLRKILNPEVKGKADGALVTNIVNELLG